MIRYKTQCGAKLIKETTRKLFFSEGITKGCEMLQPVR
jgi:hypothetical protein